MGSTSPVTGCIPYAVQDSPHVRQGGHERVWAGGDGRAGTVDQCNLGGWVGGLGNLAELTGETEVWEGNRGAVSELRTLLCRSLG